MFVSYIMHSEHANMLLSTIVYHERRSNPDGLFRQNFFFIMVLEDMSPFFVGPLIPLFWTSGDVSSGFQSQSGFCLIRA